MVESHLNSQYCP